jgi:hypothetical protein
MIPGFGGESVLSWIGRALDPFCMTHARLFGWFTSSWYGPRRQRCGLVGQGAPRCCQAKDRGEHFVVLDRNWPTRTVHPQIGDLSSRPENIPTASIAVHHEDHRHEGLVQRLVKRNGLSLRKSDDFPLPRKIGGSFLGMIAEIYVMKQMGIRYSKHSGFGIQLFHFPCTQTKFGRKRPESNGLDTTIVFVSEVAWKIVSHTLNLITLRCGPPPWAPIIGRRP